MRVVTSVFYDFLSPRWPKHGLDAVCDPSRGIACFQPRDVVAQRFGIELKPQIDENAGVKVVLAFVARSA